jgi:hypothetical protein
MASIMVIVALGLGLAGCRVENGKAAFVGNTTITEDQVSQVYDEAVSQARAAAEAEAASPSPTPEGSPEPSPSPAGIDLPVTRQDVVDLMVSIELGRRVVLEKKMPAPQQPANPAEIAAALRVPPDSAYARMWAAWFDILVVIIENTPRGQLTDAGMMKVYDALVEARAVQPGLPVDQVRQGLSGAVFAEAAIIAAGALSEQAERTETSVNPKYEPLSVPMQVNGQDGQPIFFNVPYLSSDMVTDVSL